MPWGQNLLLILQIAVVETAACPLSLHTPSAVPFCMLFAPLAAQVILSFSTVRIQSLVAFRF